MKMTISISGRQIGQASIDNLVQSYLEDGRWWIFRGLEYVPSGVGEWIVYGPAVGEALFCSDFDIPVDVILPFGWRECRNGYEATRDCTNREAERQEAIKFREGLIADFLRRNPHCGVREQQALMIFLSERVWNPEEHRACPRCGVPTPADLWAGKICQNCAMQEEADMEWSKEQDARDDVVRQNSAMDTTCSRCGQLVGDGGLCDDCHSLWERQQGIV